MVIPPGAGSAVRSYEVRRWHLRALWSVLTAFFVLTLGGGIWLGLRLQEDEIDAAFATASDAEVRLTAMADTIRTLRTAAAPVPAAAPTAPAGRPTAAPARGRPAPTAVRRESAPPPASSCRWTAA
jgi:hypothetical protein